jgi:hypothetical protein
VLVALASASAACSLLTNLGDLADSGADAGPDVVADTSEAGSDVAPPQSRYCTTVDATFCDDFESDGSFFPPWTTLVTQGDASVGRTFADSGAVLFTVGAPTDASARAYLNKAFLTATGHFRYAFDMQIAAYPSAASGSTNVNEVNLIIADAGGLSSGAIFLTIGATSSSLVEQHRFADGGYSNAVGSPFSPLNVGEWRHFDLDIDVDAGSASLAIDGTPAAMINFAPVYTAGAPTIYAGIPFENATTDQFVLVVDNTAVWLE